jgi:CO/xanthine dehydrogenase FAD-binding subunit
MRNLHVGVIGANDYPIRLTSLEKMLENKVFSLDLLEHAIDSGLIGVNPPVDPQVPQTYRFSLISTMIRRAFEKSLA